MSFTGIHFYLCLLLLVLVLSQLKQNSSKKNLLLIFSYYFYMSWDWRFAALLFSMSAGNFWFGRMIVRGGDKGKTFWLWASLIFSLSILAVFKYFNFFLENVAQVSAWLGLQSHISLVEIILPVGISFYTFQALSYTIDLYRKETQESHSLRDFMLFVSFFPQLVAGPIVRAKFFLPQLDSFHEVTQEEKFSAIFLILKGLIKKVVLADTLARQLVDPAFSSFESVSGSFLLAGIIAYSFQVYLDFSAYTDIARGAARLVGYKLPVNFDRPYMATSVSNFWQRWHISMSSFFRDYLYFSLGGSKHGNVYINLLITFAVIGLWHGAGWNFIVYGVCHGALLGIERRGRALGYFSPKRRVDVTFAIVRTFFIVAMLRVLFRADTLSEAGRFIICLLENPFWGGEFTVVGLVVLFVSIILHYIPVKVVERFEWYFASMAMYGRVALIVAVCYALVPFSAGEAPFVYFQF